MSTDPPGGTAFYAQPRLVRSVRAREWWTVLHPPYTMLHLALVTIGACLVGPLSLSRYLETLGAFFLALGVAAHALDELTGRPLRTSIPSSHLIAAAALGLGGAVGWGVWGMYVMSPYLGVFIVVGAFCALSYNLELFGGRLHRPIVLDLAWGAFPILTAYFAQHGSLGVAAVAAGVFGALVTELQRTLSTPARELRRRTLSLEGTFTRLDGTIEPLRVETILAPLERSLKVLCWLGVALAAALAYLRLR